MPSATTGGGGNFSQQQIQNAAIIYQVGRQMGMSTRDIQIALITSMTESNLINVNYGDRDSLGLFQQRPSQGWGTPEQVTNPVYASKKFYTALRGLGDRRYQMGMGEAAQAVQRSAYPDRYATHIGQARALWPAIQKAGGGKPQSLAGGDYDIDGSNLLDGLPQLDPTTGLPTGGGGSLPPIPGSPLTAGDVYDAAYGTDTPAPTSVGTPSVDAMLGAWGMGSTSLSMMEDALPDAPRLGAGMALDDLGVMPLANPSTNTSIIQPMSQTSGSFEAGVDGWRKAVIQYAKTALGKPYVWGGTNLATGVDCSGLIQAAFAKAGLQMPRVSYQQANFGTRVGLDALQAGDLVAWDNSSRNNGADHIALYIGNGQIIEAARTGIPVRIRSISGDEGAFGVHLNIGKK